MTTVHLILLNGESIEWTYQGEPHQAAEAIHTVIENREAFEVERPKRILIIPSAALVTAAIET